MTRPPREYARYTSEYVHMMLSNSSYLSAAYLVLVLGAGICFGINNDDCCEV